MTLSRTNVPLLCIMLAGRTIVCSVSHRAVLYRLFLTGSEASYPAATIATARCGNYFFSSRLAASCMFSPAFSTFSPTFSVV